MKQGPAEGFDIDDEEIIFEHTNSTAEDEEFDASVRYLEELLLDEQFQSMLESFYESNCGRFEETKENKLEYTDIYNQYTNLIETTIENHLSKKIPNFSMKRFEALISAKKDELDGSGEVFDLLTTLGDFLEFKDNMVSYKLSKKPAASKAADASDDFFDLCITGQGPSRAGKSNSSSSSSSNRSGTNKPASQQQQSFDFAITGKKL